MKVERLYGEARIMKMPTLYILEMVALGVDMGTRISFI